MKKIRIFVTGGEGFIGSSLIAKLIAKKYCVASYDAQLSFIDKPEYYQKVLTVRKKHFAQPTEKYIGDIRDLRKLREAISDFKPNIIVHLAGLPMARVSEKYKSEMAPINMQGTLNVLNVFEQSVAEKIIYTSSSMAYGHFKQTPQSENVILDPINEYGACKAAGEYFIKLSEKKWTIVRPTSVYGLADAANRVTQMLLDAAFLGKSAWVVKGETLDFSYIEDVSDGFMLIIENENSSGKTFNISRGESRSAEEFANLLKGFFPNFTFDVKEASKQQVWRGPLDISFAKHILNYQPKYSIEEGISETIRLSNKYKFYQGLS